MSHRFDLVITADNPSRSAEFRLLDGQGATLAQKHTDFSAFTVGRMQGLFDLRNFLRHYVEENQQVQALAEIGVCIAEDVLGTDIFGPLWQPQSQRTLRIQLPGAADEDNHLAAALTRVPWEIARPTTGQPTLGERNLLVRVVHDMHAPASQPLALNDGEALRVLFVFAEARGSQPLGARQERLALQRMLQAEVYPQRRVVAHFLSHGVTRQRLEAQIVENGGYHLVHWSGHGHLNLLELARPGGEKDHLSGDELLALFHQAGGFLPQLVFLSACHSGDIARVHDWNDFIAVARGQEPATATAAGATERERASSEAVTRKLDLADQPGFTGTAHALLRGGVPSVVAMRFAVGDDYARELSVEFYRALLAHPQPKNAAAALTLARRALLSRQQQGAARYAVCDHATPLLYGDEQPGLEQFHHRLQGSSPALDQHNRRLPPMAELNSAVHEHFVGRTWQLAELGASFIGSRRHPGARPVAVVLGLGGMGKTALLAEALALWEQQFQWLLLFQAKPHALSFETFLREVHLRLRGEAGDYYRHVQKDAVDAVYRESNADFNGPQRLQRLTLNLVRALKAEPMLLVLDNFETNLVSAIEGAADSGANSGENSGVSIDTNNAAARCQEPAWDDCLATLARELVGSPSRVLLSCRRPLAALDISAVCTIQLGPLPATEAALFLRANPALSRMVLGTDASEQTLVMRLLNASRFHPLLMDQLAKLAAAPALRANLLQALQALETTKAFALLPALFAAEPGDIRELDYLTDALATSLDQLIQQASPDARRVLWLLALANEPVTLGLLNRVWRGDEDDAEPAALQQGRARPELAPLLRHLFSVGLVTEMVSEPGDPNPDLSCHELVRERIGVWMALQARDRSGWTEKGVRLAYATHLQAYFQALQHQDMSAALQAGSRALVYCVQAEAWDRLGGFASGVVTSTRDPRLLEGLMPHLRAAADAAPDGPPRWRCLGTLAEALRGSGRPDSSLPFFQQAADSARNAAEAGDDDAEKAWADLAVTTGNWASALRDTGNLGAARQRRLDSAAAHRNAGSPAVHTIGSELEALRIDLEQGRLNDALPQIQARLTQVESWWQQQRSGEPVSEAPDAEFLARAYIGALNITNDAHRALLDWPSALSCTDTILKLKRALQRPAEDIAGTRLNRAVELGALRRFPEARAELEACLPIFQHDPPMASSVLSALAKLFNDQGDPVQAISQLRRALAIFEQLPKPAERASSHNNLANYLERHDTATTLAEAPLHQLAALTYRLVAGLGKSLQISSRNYAIDFRRARTTSTEPAVPRLGQLLANPAFNPLAQWLAQRQVNVDEVQANIDQFLNQARQAASE